MATIQRLITRSGFSQRLGLNTTDLTRRPCSVVADAITTFYDLDGNIVGEHHLKHSPLTPWDDETFILYAEEESGDLPLEAMCA